MVKIYCKKETDRHDFFMATDKEEYYLFSQSVKKSVDSFYKRGVLLDKALNHGIGRKDHAVHHTMDKLRKYIKYVEAQHDIVVLRQTDKKSKCAA